MRGTMSTNNQTGRLSPHSLLQQRYMILGQVGRGGMGAVYVAMDTRLGHRRVAIKEMSQANLNSTELTAATARFQQEADMLGKLSHPNLPRIYDSFSEQERSYLVMDFIEGQNLHQILKSLNGQPLSLAQSLLYARQLCDVLAYLHQQNPPIIFRDVKPTNVMVTQSGQVYLIDFGIARVFKEGQQQDTIFLGSPGYAPPEQHGISQTNPRSDIYGLGATLHYCLTGRDPYYSDDRFSFLPVRQFNPQVPAELDQLVQRMVDQDERARPASALEVQQALLGLTQRASEFTTSLSPAAPASAPTKYIAPVPPPVSTANPASPGYGSQQSVMMPQFPTVVASPTPHSAPRLGGSYNAHTPLSPGYSSPSPWSARFLITFGLFLLVTAGSGFYALSFTLPGADPQQLGWAFIIESALALLLFLVALSGSILVRGSLSRSMLILTGLAALIASIGLAGIGDIDVRNMLLIFLPFQSFGAILSAGLALATLASIYWLFRRFSWIDRGILAVLLATTLICVYQQVYISNNATFNKHILLVMALVALIHAVLLATQAERVSERTGRGLPKSI